MRYVVFAVPDEVLDRVLLVEPDPRDGAVQFEAIAKGTAYEVGKVILERCPLHSLQELTLSELRRIKQRVAHVGGHREPAKAALADAPTGAE